MTGPRIYAIAIAIGCGLAWGACGSSDTRIHLEVTVDPTLDVDTYELRLGTISALADVRPAIDVGIPDSAAGEPGTFQVWGLSGGTQVAYGTAAVTPSKHETVTVAITLSAVDCGVFCTEGAVECEGDGTVTCEVQDTGCLAFSTPTPCPTATPFCSGGACAAQCTDDCAIGQTECDSAEAFRTCGQFDSDTCLDWSAPMACTAGTTCSNGTCGTPATCSTDGSGCDDGNPCTTGDTCEGGACSGQPKCTTAPPDADPTCAGDGTCGFTCHVGFSGSGASCVPAAVMDLPTARAYLAAAVGPDNKVYAFAGDVEATTTQYTPSTNTWVTRAAMPTARQAPCAVTGGDGSIYVIGGSDGTNFLATVEAYNPATNAWATRTAMPTARGFLACALGSDGLIYAIGGNTGATFTTTVEAYNPTANSWATRAAMPTARTNLAAAVGPDGLIYAIGGKANNNVYVMTNEAFDPTANRWTTATAMTSGRGDLAAATGSDGMIYAIGGYAGGADLTTVAAYNPTTKTWINRAALPSARANFASVALGGLIYAIGGNDVPSGTELSSVSAYSPAGNVW